MRVLIIQEHLPAFRVGFYELLREKLTSRDIQLDLIYAPNQRNTFLKGELSWAQPVPIRWIGPLGWQPVLGRCGGYDLIIVQQETKYMLNPVLQVWSFCGGPKVAYWGHGKNFQKSAETGIKGFIKNLLAKRVDWWFAYNDLSAKIIADLGFPAERITSVGNAVDTTGMRKKLKELKPSELEALRKTCGIHSQNIAVYTGGLYPNKRIRFLIEAAQLIRKELPDFELIIIGDGPERMEVTQAAKKNSWIHDIGPKDDNEKVPFWALAKLLLMPGLVGLVVVDSFALGVPLITTDYPFHSPEIDYLKNEENGWIVACGDDVAKYAAAVIQLLRDPVCIAALKQGAIQSASKHTIEKMADNFNEGIVRALNHSTRLID